jgi:hypothetical protein
MLEKHFLSSMVVVVMGVMSELSKPFLPNLPKTLFSPSHLKISATPLGATKHNQYKFIIYFNLLCTETKL